MTNPTVPQGFLGVNLGNLIPDVAGLIPGPIGDAIAGAVGTILGPDGPNIGDPQPPGPPPIPTHDPAQLNAAVKAIDVVLGGIALILKFGFLIPDTYEEPLRMLSGALSTIRGWLD